MTIISSFEICKVIYLNGYIPKNFEINQAPGALIGGNAISCRTEYDFRLETLLLLAPSTIMYCSTYEDFQKPSSFGLNLI